MTRRWNKAELFVSLPPVWPEDSRPAIRAAVAANPGHKLVVLDDDPTGTQTVHDVPVLTEWSVESLRREVAAPGPCFYILTNSRSLPPAAARELNREIARHLREATEHRSFTLVSRSDSTLRGHFPLETDALAEELGPFDATILVPYFEAGGRYTIGDVHFVAEGDTLVPAAETAFARDAVFGYCHSNLREWVEEKTTGRVRAADVQSISIEELRTGSPTHEPMRQVLVKLLALRHGAVCVVNACHPRDLECFALATIQAEKAGARFLFRTAAQFVAARLGLEERPFVRPDDLAANPADGKPPFQSGGLTVVGSHVPKTTEQLAHLLNQQSTISNQQSAIAPLELNVSALLSPATRAAEIVRATAEVSRLIGTGRDTVIFTSRKLIAGDSAEASLAINGAVSEALVQVIQGIASRPRYLIAKGGITSSDLATRGLGVKRALVRGQILPGVPVWQLGAESRWPGLAYVVFPGNVGGPEALAEAIEKLKIGN